MKRATVFLTLAALLLLSLAPGCGRGVAGSGKLETRDYDISGFTGVAAEDAFTIEVREGSAYDVRVTADGNVFKYLDVRKRGSTLHLGLRPGVPVTSATLSAVVTTPRLEALALSEASDGRIVGFRGSLPLALTLSGASSLVIEDAKTARTTATLSGGSDLSGKLTATSIAFSLSGASNAALRGTATDAAITASGGSHVDFQSFVAKNATVNLSGASHGFVFANGDLRVKLSGASHLDYDGNPKLRAVDVSGGSSLTEV